MRPAHPDNFCMSLKDFSDDSGIFPSHPFLKMVKIQNGKQWSHMGND